MSHIDPESQSRQDALSQKISELSLLDGLGQPPSVPEALHGMRSTMLGPDPNTLQQGGRRKKVVRGGAFETGLEAIKNAVERRVTITIDSTLGSSNPRSPFTTELEWYKSKSEAITKLGRLPPNTANTLGARRAVLTEKIDVKIKELAELESKWRRSKAKASYTQYKDTRYYGLPENEPEPEPVEPLEINCSKLIQHPFIGLPPIAAYLILLVAIVCIMGKLPQAWTRFLLTSIQRTFSILPQLYNFKDKAASAYIQKIHDNIPRDIRKVQSTLQLNPPPSTTYACCPNPKCSFIYPPDSSGRWPELCDNHISDSDQCCTPLLKKVPDPSNLKVSRHPIRPYVLYDIKTQIAELVTMEPYASLLTHRNPRHDGSSLTEGISDIFDGQLVRDFRGPLTGPNNTRHWFDSPQDEARLLFTLSVDWMNPYGVKAAGVSASVGVIALCCVNLPISVRYKPENIILSGLIPGPQEPILDTVNHFLRPIIDDFLILWERGLKMRHTSPLTSTKYKRVRAAILSLVTDLPASKKISGNLSHGADAFCTLCDIRKADMDNLDIDSWPIRTCKQHRDAAFEWLQASPERRKELAKLTGVRFSELDRLPYLDPIRQIVIDIMHGLFLGIIKRHYTKVFGMDDSSRLAGGAHLYQPIDVDKFKKGRRILNSRGRDSVSAKLQNACTWPDLYALSEECGVTLNADRHKNTKRSMADALDNWRLSDNSQILNPDAAIPVLDVLDPTVGRILDRSLLLKIRKAAQDMFVPTWMTKLPQSFGSASGGSLKADQWRVIATLYAPIVLIMEWPKSGVPDSSAWLKLTTDLMSAIYSCSSHTVSTESINNYKKFMISYLSGIKTHFESISWVPNYHAALHIPKLLEEYGPAFGWWTFPFERIIRELQNVPNNSRMGELERTMAESFYLSSRLRRYGYANQFGASGEVMKGAVTDMIVGADAIFGSRIKGTLVSDVFQVMETLSRDTEDNDDPGNENVDDTEGKPQFRNRVNHRGFVFSTAAFSLSNSHIFLKQDLSLYQIQRIVESGGNNKKLQLIIRKFQEESTETHDPYAAYPLLRAKIWLRDLILQEITVNAEDVRCHAAVWNYSATNCVSVVLDRGTWI